MSHSTTLLLNASVCELPVLWPKMIYSLLECLNGQLRPDQAVQFKRTSLSRRAPRAETFGLFSLTAQLTADQVHSARLWKSLFVSLEPEGKNDSCSGCFFLVSFVSASDANKMALKVSLVCKRCVQLLPPRFTTNSSYCIAFCDAFCGIALLQTSWFKGRSAQAMISARSCLSLPTRAFRCPLVVKVFSRSARHSSPCATDAASENDALRIIGFATQGLSRAASASLSNQHHCQPAHPAHAVTW
jgi:hypothetical protein